MKQLLPILSLLMVGCSVLPQPTPVDLYRLPPPVNSASESQSTLPALAISRPLSSEALAGNRLLIMTADNQFQAFAGVRLASAVPLLWRDWLLEAFARDGRVVGLSAASEALEAEFELGGMLQSFQVESPGAQSEAVIIYQATLSNQASRQVIASRRFEARQPMRSTDAQSAILALGAAANQILPDLLQWTTNATR